MEITQSCDATQPHTPRVFYPHVGFSAPTPVLSAYSMWALSNSQKEEPYVPEALSVEVIEYLNNKTVHVLPAVKHHMYNVNSVEDVLRLDSILRSLSILLDTKRQAMFTLHSPSVTDIENFRRLPFQQLMLVYMINSMIDHCDMCKYRVLIFALCKDRLGLSFLSWEQCNYMLHRFTTTSVFINSIPRQHGKTTYMCGMFCLCICVFPEASLNMLYTAHTKNICSNMYNAIYTMIMSIVQTYNNIERTAYERRCAAVGGAPMLNDNEIQMAVLANTTNLEIECIFSHKNKGSGEMYVTSNKLRCQVYSKQGVCIIIYCSILLYSKCVIKIP